MSSTIAPTTTPTATTTETDADPRGGNDPTQRGWLELSAALTDEAAMITDRDDLVVTIGPGLGQGSPACFDPHNATIEVDGTHLGTLDPATAIPAAPADRDRYPIMWGLLTHECAHAQHTRWATATAAGTSPGVHAAASLLDESRIEAAHIRRRPDDRHWLRASATALILTPTAPTIPPTGTTPATNGDQSGKTQMSRWDAARAAALLLARVDAGILTPAETAPVTREVEAALGASTLAELRTVWQDAHALDDSDTEGMLALGARWCATLAIDPDTIPDPTPSCSGAGNHAATATRTAGSTTPTATPAAAGAPGTAAGAPGTAAPGTGTNPGPDPSPLEQAITEALATLATARATETSPTQPPHTSKTAPTRGPIEASTSTRPGTAAHTVFTQGGTRSRGAEYGHTATTGTRAPSAAERVAARTLGRALSTAGIRDRVRTTTSSPLPPGRLRMRGVLTGQAQRAAGAIPTAEPFTQITRTIVPTPPLRLGIACDVSGSMVEFAGPVASTAWIFAHAVHHAHLPGSTTATVIFGNRVRPITHPATTPRQVTEFNARDGLHDIPTAIDALDGALGLSLPGAARLLVIVSDGLYHGNVRDNGQAKVTALRATGCAVLWLAPDSGSFTQIEPFDNVTVCPLTDPATTAQTIGRAATTALRTTR